MQPAAPVEETFNKCYSNVMELLHRCRHLHQRELNEQEQQRMRAVVEATEAKHSALATEGTLHHQQLVNADLRHQLESLRGQLSEREAECGRFKLQLGRHASEVSHLSAQLEQRGADVASLKLQLEAREEELAVTKLQLARAEQERSEPAGAEEAEALREALAASEARNSELVGRNQNLEREKADLISCWSRIKHLQAESAGRSRRVQAEVEAKAALQVDRDRVLAEYNALRDTYQTLVAQTAAQAAMAAADRLPPTEPPPRDSDPDPFEYPGGYAFAEAPPRAQPAVAAAAVAFAFRSPAPEAASTGPSGTGAHDRHQQQNQQQKQGPSYQYQHPAEAPRPIQQQQWQPQPDAGPPTGHWVVARAGAAASAAPSSPPPAKGGASKAGRAMAAAAAPHGSPSPSRGQIGAKLDLVSRSPTPTAKGKSGSGAGPAGRRLTPPCSPMIHGGPERGAGAEEDVYDVPRSDSPKNKKRCRTEDQAGQAQAQGAAARAPPSADPPRPVQPALPLRPAAPGQAPGPKSGQWVQTSRRSCAGAGPPGRAGNGVGMGTQDTWLQKGDHGSTQAIGKPAGKSAAAASAARDAGSDRENLRGAGAAGQAAAPAAAAPRPVAYVHDRSNMARTKAEKEALPGQECANCRAFYQTLASNGEVQALGAFGRDAQGNLHCGHRAAVQELSRHRARYERPSTPDGYWDLGFRDEKDKSTQDKWGTRVS